MPEKAARLTAASVSFRGSVAPVFAPRGTVFEHPIGGFDYDIRVIIAVHANHGAGKKIWNASDRPQLHALNGRVC